MTMGEVRLRLQSDVTGALLVKDRRFVHTSSHSYFQSYA
jgi:hypothetical protein